MDSTPPTAVHTRLDDAALASARRTDGFTWIDLVAPSIDEVEQAGAELGWHPLLVEDVAYLGQRSKIEPYRELVFAVMYGATTAERDEQPELVEVAVVVHGNYVVTVRPTDVANLDDLRRSISDLGAGLVEAGVVYRIVDRIVDSTMVASRHLSNRVEQLEDLIEAKPGARLLPELRRCRREVAAFRSVLGSQRDALRDLPPALGELDELEASERIHFRDVSDHAWRVSNELDLTRELVDGAFEAYFAALATHQGAVAQRLTVIATIFLPLTFVTGFFGQNFGWMVDHISSEGEFLLFGVGSSALSALVLIALFRRLHWW